MNAKDVIDGKSLISYAVHYQNAEISGPHPSDLLVSIPELGPLLIAAGVPGDLFERYHRSPLQILSDFSSYLTVLEEASPSNEKKGSRRSLSNRETAIIVARFLTYPDGEEFTTTEDVELAPVSKRQMAALALPDRESPSFRRFDMDRSLASTGHYWRQFAAEFLGYLRRTSQADLEETVGALSEDVQQLLRFSDQYDEELRGQIYDRVTDVDLYVHRDLESVILDAIESNHDLVIIKGDAGTGKSSMLWSLSRQLRDRGRLAVLVSATWMTGGTDGLITTENLVDHLTVISNARLRPVLLLDTADLLLHSEGLIYQTVDLLTRLRTAGVCSVLTVRPVEADFLPSFENALHQTIGGYSEEGELPEAITTLMKRYLPGQDPQLGLDLIRTVQTRGLPALAILQSPLLLRMLFDLSEGELPSVDLDVSDLYERYWHFRVLRDRRSSRYTARGDLGHVAARVGVLMLAEGRPTLTARHIENTLGQVSFPVALPDDLSDTINLMARRGVLIPAGSQLRFAHQTLFEFAAAKGLMQRGAGTMVRRLLEEMKLRPHDQFTGAVMEQLLILMSSEPSTLQVAREVTQELLGLEHPSLRRVGVIAWSHIPGLIVEDAVISALDENAVKRILGHMPQVRQLDITVSIWILEKIWERAKDWAHREYFSCLLRLIRRWPREVSGLVKNQRIIEYVIENHRATQTQPDLTIELVMLLREEDPVYAGEVALLLLTNLPDVNGRVKLLHQVAERWSPITDAEFVHSLIQAATRSERDFGSSLRNFGIACGQVLYRHLELVAGKSSDSAEQWWRSFAVGVIEEMFSGQPTVGQSAQRHALGRHLLDSENYAHISAILDQIFGHDAENGPPQIVGSFLLQIVKGSSLVTQMVADRLFEILERGLPANARTNETSQQRWAITARATLAYPDVPPDIFRSVTDALLPTEPLLWRRPDLMLSLLLPAALAGVSRAVALTRDIIRDPSQLSPPGSSKDEVRASQNELLQSGADYASQSPSAAEAVLSLALHTQRTATIRALLHSPTGIKATTTRLREINDLLTNKLRGQDRDHRDAAGLMQQLQAHGLIAPTVDQLGHWLASMRDPAAQASVLDMLPQAVRSNPQQASLALGLIEQHALEKNPESEWNTMSDVRRRLVDTGLRAYRGILAQSGIREAWEPLWELVRRPPLQGRGVIQTDWFRDVTSFLRSVDLDDLEHAVFTAERVVQVGRWLVTNTSPKQSRVVSNYLTSTARRLVRSPHAQARRILIDESPHLPAKLAETIIVTAVSTSESGYVSDLVQAGTLSGELAHIAIERLRANREVGFAPLPWLISG